MKIMSNDAKLIVLLFLFWVGICTSPAVAQTEKRPLKIFILAGQSNMQGHAKVSTFDYIGDDPETAPMLNEMRDSDGQPRMVKNTWISYLTHGRETPNGEGFGQLTAGYGARTDPAEDGGKIGPEFTFGIFMQKSLNQPILIIKTAWGGKSLHTDFRPPSAGPYQFNDSELESIKKRGLDLEQEQAKRKKQTGVYYRLMIEHVKTVLQDIKRVCPDYHEDHGYEIAGFVWFQGWNDLVNSGVYPQRGQPGGYDKYSQWMGMFIRDVRKDLATPDMPFVIGVIGVDGPIENVAQRYRAIHGSFRSAMAAPAALPEFQGNVVAVKTAESWDMPLDQIQKRKGELNAQKRTIQKRLKDGELTQSESESELAKIDAVLNGPEIKGKWDRGASNAAYHYYGCAKTMALIGKSFAEAILELQAE